MKYRAPNINKYIVNLWKLIAYLESTFVNYYANITARKCANA